MIFINKRFKYFFFFFVPFIVRILTCFYLIRIFKIGTYDIFIYIPVGVDYINGLIRSNLNVFLENCEHPPLAKIIIGISVILFSKILDEFKAAALSMIIISSCIALIVYKIGNTIDKKTGFISWLMYTFDPFSIHWTLAWLDIPMLFFLTAGIYYLFFRKKENPTIAGILFGLAFLCKYTSIIIVVALILIYTIIKKMIFSKKSLLSLILSFSILLILNPQYWNSKYFTQILSRNEEVGNINFPLIFHLPSNIYFTFWALSYIWAFSNNNVNTFPLIIDFIGFIIILYRYFQHKKLKYDLKILSWLSATLLILSILPKHYVYYNIIIIPPLSLFTATLITGRGERCIKYRYKLFFFLIPIGFLLALSILSVMFALIFPSGWLFIGDLIRNYRIFGIISIFAYIITFISCIWSIFFAYLFLFKNSIYF